MYGTDVQNHAVSGWLCTSTSSTCTNTLFQTCHGRSSRQDSGPHIILTENIIYMNKHTNVGTVQYCTLERCETVKHVVPRSIPRDARLSVMTNSTSDSSTSRHPYEHIVRYALVIIVRSLLITYMSARKSGHQ